MKSYIKQGLVACVIVAGAVALSGCYESDQSIIASADSIMPIKVGHYCQYDFDDAQRQWGTECTSVDISSPSANTYTIKDNDIETEYTVHISGKPLTMGDLSGNYLVEACDAKDTTQGCYVGTLKVFDNTTFHFVLPTCTGVDDECKLADENAAREAFADATTWGTDELRKYVWQS